MSQTIEPASSPTAPKRRRRWPRVVLVTLLLLFGFPTCLYLYMSWSATRDTENALAETDRLDPGWRLDDIEAARETLDADKNSALFIIKLNGKAGRNSRTWRQEFTDAMDGLDAPYQLSPLQLEMLRDAYEGLDDIRAEARLLKDMPKGRFPIKYSADGISTLLPNQQDARRIFEILQHDAWLRAQHGDIDGAIESCRACMNAARSLGDEPILISFLIRVAGDHIALAALERTLAQGRQPSDQALAAMQQLIEQEMVDVEKHWKNALRGERAIGQRFVKALDERKLPVSALLGGGFIGPGQPTVGDRVADWFPIFITREYPDLLRYMNDAVEASQLPLEQQVDRLRGLEKSIPRKGILVRLLAPALEKVSAAHVRDHAFLRTAQVAVAAERFRLKQTPPRWPESLAELVKSGLLADVPDDPYDGAPLRYRLWPEGVKAYSVGNDKVDDGGNINRDRPLEKGTDFGFRLWHAERRRQPARAPAPK